MCVYIGFRVHPSLSSAALSPAVEHNTGGVSHTYRYIYREIDRFIYAHMYICIYMHICLYLTASAFSKLRSAFTSCRGTIPVGESYRFGSYIYIYICRFKYILYIYIYIGLRVNPSPNSAALSPAVQKNTRG